MLDLVDRVVVAEPGPVLLVEVQPEAQAGGVDPPVADLAQAPYSPRLGQGVCDLRQALRVGDRGEAVALFSKTDLLPLRLAGDELVPAPNHLSTERRMPGHLDRQVAPVGVHDVERVVVDERLLLGQVQDHPGLRAAHVPHRCRRAGDQDHEHPRPHRVLGQVFLGDLVLAFPPPAVDDRHAVGLGPRPHPPGEPPSQTHQMRVVQLLIRVPVQPPPPRPEPTRAVTQREVPVQHDPVHTVIRPDQQPAPPLAQRISHPRTVRDHPTPAMTAPAGATHCERSLTMRLASLARHGVPGQIKFQRQAAANP